MGSFTISCDQCGSERVLREDDLGCSGDVELEYFHQDDSINLFCINIDCPSVIDIANE